MIQYNSAKEKGWACQPLPLSTVPCPFGEVEQFETLATSRNGRIRHLLHSHFGVDGGLGCFLQLEKISHCLPCNAAHSGTYLEKRMPRHAAAPPSWLHKSWQPGFSGWWWGDVLWPTLSQVLAFRGTSRPPPSCLRSISEAGCGSILRVKKAQVPKFDQSAVLPPDPTAPYSDEQTPKKNNNKGPGWIPRILPSQAVSSTTSACKCSEGKCAVQPLLECRIWFLCASCTSARKEQELSFNAQVRRLKLLEEACHCVFRSTRAMTAASSCRLENVLPETAWKPCTNSSNIPAPSCGAGQSWCRSDPLRSHFTAESVVSLPR